MAKFGATGDFPRGKLNDSDEGGLQIGVTVKDKTVVVVFGTPVAWLGMPAEAALQLANALLQRVNEITLLGWELRKKLQHPKYPNPDLPKLLRAVAASSAAMATEQCVILKTAADELEHWRKQAGGQQQ